MIFENSLPKANFGQNIRDLPNGSLTADSRSLQTATLNYVGMKQRLNNMEGYGGASDATLFQALSSCLSVCSFLNLNTTKPRIRDFAFKWRGKKP